MISIDGRRIGAFVAFALAAAPALAGPLVVRAAGPSAAVFKPGARLPDAPLVLKAGDQVTVLDERGTRSFTGPGTFSFTSASAAAAPTEFTALLTQKAPPKARIGAVRGSAGEMTGPPTPPGIWAIDSGKSDTVCALDPAKSALWRAEPMAAGTLTVTRVSDGKSAPVAFTAGQATAPWPADVVPAGGDQFRISGGKAPAMITVRKLGSEPAALDQLGAAFLEAGCQGQFDRLTTVTKVASN